MDPDRRKLIRLAYTRPELRPALLPLLKEARGITVFLDVPETVDVGDVFIVQDDGVRSDHGSATEFLHQVESTDGRVDGHVISRGQSLRSGSKIQVERLLDRSSAGYFAGEVKVRVR